MISKTKQCILCPYKKEENCLYNHDECYSLSNIYYGYVIKIFPFNIIDKTIDKVNELKEDIYCKNLENKYGDINKENDELKFIWGIKSYDDLCEADCGFYTMNDIDIVYDKKDNCYLLGVETAYCFPSYESTCDYLKNLLKCFTKYMDDNGFDKNRKLNLFMSQPCTDLKAKSIEELYTNFKIFVNGYCSLGENNND